MASTTPNNVGKNSVLLFGDYGTEIMRLSQLYDPKQDRYQKNTDPRPITGEKYFTITLRDRTIYFEEVETINDYTVDGTLTGEFKTDTPLWKDTGKEAQNGYYVPVPQTMVVVDRATYQWGTYTLLIVDSVDPETYESTLVPVNFTGGVDTAVRAIDWNNNLLNLFVDEITLGNEDRKVYKLTPDRKILAYGAGEIAYLIKKNIDGIMTVINTDSTANAAQDAERFVTFESAASFVDYRVRVVKDKADFEVLNGQTIQFYDQGGKKNTLSVNIVVNPDGSYDAETESLYAELRAVTDRGEDVRVYSDSQDAVTRVQLPQPAYLRSSISPLTPGEEVFIEVYENIPEQKVYRLITTYRVIVREGVPINPADLTKGQIVGFDVKLQGEIENDVWEIPVGTDPEDVKLIPLLKMDDGSKVDASVLKNVAFFQYGMHQLVNAPVGTEFDVLFKYFPLKAIGMENSTSINTRYVKETAATPSPIKRYFRKNGAAWEIAENDGHPTAFTAGVEYYFRAQKLSWQTSINRPSRDFITCTKRIHVVNSRSSELRKICVIPLWNYDTETWSLKYLAYKSDYLPPKLIDSGASEYGQIQVAGGDPVLDVNEEYNNAVQHLTLHYRPNANVPYWTDAPRHVSLLLQHFTSDLPQHEKWLIGGEVKDIHSSDVNVYGRQTGTIRRPYILCKTPSMEGDSQVYRIPVDVLTGFPVVTSEGEQRNTFVEMFYKRALTDEDVANNWAASIAAPSHFRIRATDNVDTHATEWIRIVPERPDDENDLGYGNPINVDGLGLPDPAQLSPKGAMGIVIMEFAAMIGGSIKVLLGVPVEVREQK